MHSISFYGNFFYGGGFFQVQEQEGYGAGKGDNPKGKRKKSNLPLYLPYKPTGLVDRPKAKTPIDVRVEETREIHREVTEQLAKTIEAVPRPLEFTPVELMSQAQIDYEIGVLMRQKMRTEEEELMMFMLMVADEH